MRPRICRAAHRSATIAPPSTATFRRQGQPTTDTPDNHRQVIDEARKLVDKARLPAHPRAGAEAARDEAAPPHQWHNFRLGRVCERCGVIQANDEFADTVCEPRAS